MNRKWTVFLLAFAGMIVGIAGCGGSDRPRGPVKILNATDAKVMGQISLDGLKKGADEEGLMMPGGGGPGGGGPGGGPAPGGGPGPGGGPAPGPGPGKL